MRIFVTGGTGYIGLQLCRRLARDGHELRCLVRATSRAEPLTELGASCFVGDLADRESMREAMSSADWVVHAAAELDLTRPPEEMEEANVGGSENVASLAHELGVARFLSVSSISFFGSSPDDGSPADEDGPQQPSPTRYSATKHAGQKAVMRWAEQGLRVNTVYPSLVYGPPNKKSGANPLIRKLSKGWIHALTGSDRITSWIFVEDLVDGMVRVIERAAPSRDYLMAGDSATIEEAARMICELSGASMPRFRLSVPTTRLLIRAATPLLRLRGRRPPIDIEQLASLERHWHFDDSRARRELDWQPRPLAEGLPPAVEYFLR
jgi:dihydroflavonol-4-reductase